MKYVLFLISLFCGCLSVSGQYTLKIMVDKVATKATDDIYLSGNFNNWNPRDEKYKLKPFGTSRRGLVMSNLPAGNVEYKFTRGSWEKGEVSADGKKIDNRVIMVKDDVTETVQIAGWQDDYPDKPKPNTATAQVTLLDTNFNIPQLRRNRRIWIYLPKSYSSSKKYYPVLYMQDGQNLFSEHTAAFGEWGVDEALDTLQAKTGKECIVIGIDNGGEKRMSEYNPYDHEKFGEGEGKAYVSFLVETLKPYVDSKYRTLTGPAQTYIAGSSMGGLISMYAMIAHPKVFGGAGIFSPSFWVAPQIYDDAVKATLSAAAPKFYFYAGGNESGLMVPDMDKMVKLIQTKGTYQTRRIMAPLGKNNEATWRKEFAAFYTFIMQ